MGTCSVAAGVLQSSSLRLMCIANMRFYTVPSKCAACVVVPRRWALAAHRRARVGLNGHGGDNEEHGWTELCLFVAIKGSHYEYMMWDLESSKVLICDIVILTAGVCPLCIPVSRAPGGGSLEEVHGQLT